MAGQPPRNTRLFLLIALVLSAGAAPAAAADRIDAARARMGDDLPRLFTDRGVAYPPRVLLLRAFKAEGELELWAGADPAGALTKIKTYPICAASGDLGPKRRQGDLQVPEGFYEVDRYNKWSSYHLSLGINYPNRADRIIGRQLHTKPLGGNIFVHGDCVTIGCLPLQDEPIEEVFVAAWDARQKHGAKTHVHIFPARLDDASLAGLIRTRPDLAAHVRLWEQLKAGHDAFEHNRRLFGYRIDEAGRYVVNPR